MIVQLDGTAAGAFRSGRASGQDVAQLRRVLAELGISLRPQHPDIDDPELARYFVGEVRGRDDGAHVAAALTALRAVTAAYAKPTAELP